MEQSSWPPRWLTPVPAEAIKRGRHFEPVSLFAEAFGIITKDSVAGVTGGFELATLAGEPSRTPVRC